MAGYGSQASIGFGLWQTWANGVGRPGTVALLTLTILVAALAILGWLVERLPWAVATAQLRITVRGETPLHLELSGCERNP